MTRTRNILLALWPDFYVGLLLGLLAVLSLTDSGAGAAVSVGKFLGDGWGVAYLISVALGAAGLCASVAARHPVAASRCAGALAVLLVLNGGAVYMNDPGTASKLALGVYLSLGVLMTNRCIVLTYAVVVPTWLRDEVARQARRVGA